MTKKKECRHMSGDDLLKTRLGGSDASSLILSQPYTPLDLYLRIVDGVDPGSGMEAELGNAMEPIIRSQVEEWLGATITKPPTLEWKDWGRISPDGFIPALHRGWECKLRWPQTAKAYGEEGTDQVPPKDMLQVQWYMHTTQIQEWMLTMHPVLGRRKHYVIGRSEELGGLIAEAMRRFWVDHVLARRPPQPTPNSDLSRVWSGTFKKKDRVPHPATPEAEETMALLRRIQEGKKKVEALEAKLKKSLQLEIADRYGLEAPGLGKVTWARQPPRTPWKKVAMQVLAEASAAGLFVDVDKIIDELTPEEGPRVFSSYWKE